MRRGYPRLLVLTWLSVVLGISVASAASLPVRPLVHPEDRPKLTERAQRGRAVAGPEILRHQAERERRWRRLPHDLTSPGFNRSPYASRRRGWKPPVRRSVRAEDLRAGRGLLPAPDTMRVAFIRIDFLADRGGDQSTGNGRFDLTPADTLAIPIDRPPHNRRYFEAHLEALKRYYDAQSYGIRIIDGDVWPRDLDGAYSLSDMADLGPWGFTDDIYPAARDMFREHALRRRLPVDRARRSHSLGHLRPLRPDPCRQRLAERRPPGQPRGHSLVHHRCGRQRCGDLPRLAQSPDRPRRAGPRDQQPGRLLRRHQRRRGSRVRPPRPSASSTSTTSIRVSRWSASGASWTTATASGRSFRSATAPRSSRPVSCRRASIRGTASASCSTTRCCSPRWRYGVTTTLLNSERHPDVRKVTLSTDEYLMLENRYLAPADSVQLDQDDTTRVVLGPKNPDRFEYDALAAGRRNPGVARRRERPGARVRVPDRHGAAREPRLRPQLQSAPPRTRCHRGGRARRPRRSGITFALRGAVRSVLPQQQCDALRHHAAQSDAEHRHAAAHAAGLPRRAGLDHALHRQSGVAAPGLAGGSRVPARGTGTPGRRRGRRRQSGSVLGRRRQRRLRQHRALRGQGGWRGRLRRPIRLRPSG